MPWNARWTPWGLSLRTSLATRSAVTLRFGSPSEAGGQPWWRSRPPVDGGMAMSPTGIYFARSASYKPR